MLADGVVVGRIMLSPAAPQDRQWMWTLAYGYHEDRTPAHGYASTREAAMAGVREELADGVTVDPDSIYFPQPAIIEPLALAFAEMMFAHARFEEEVRRLQGSITNDSEFGERARNQWGAAERPKKMAKLIKRHLGTAPETELIVQSLADAIDACARRDLLAHGQWWRFNPKTSAVAVRGGRQRKDGRVPLEDFTVGDIATIVVKFKGLGAELYKLRSAIEQRRGDHIDESNLP